MCGLACHQSLHLIRANKVAAVPLLMRSTDVFIFESHEESCELIESLHQAIIIIRDHRRRKEKHGGDHLAAWKWGGS